MTFVTRANNIRSRWKTQIADAQSVPTQYDNGPEPSDTSGIWARFTVLEGDAYQSEISGTGSHRYIGLAQADLFKPITSDDYGDADLLGIADAVTTAFRAQTVSGITYRTPQLTNIGRDGDMHRITVRIPYFETETS